jgi:hypothetical protein
MKGYRPKEDDRETTAAKSSQKIITNMLRKYLHRKEESNTQFEVLPRLEQSS